MSARVGTSEYVLFGLVATAIVYVVVRNWARGAMEPALRTARMIIAVAGVVLLLGVLLTAKGQQMGAMIVDVLAITAGAYFATRVQ